MPVACLLLLFVRLIVNCLFVVFGAVSEPNNKVITKHKTLIYVFCQIEIGQSCHKILPTLFQLLAWSGVATAAVMTVATTMEVMDIKRYRNYT